MAGLRGPLFWCCVSFLVFLFSLCAGHLKVSEGPGYVNITSHGIAVARVRLPPNNWNLTFLDVHGDPLLPEASGKKKGLGFGRWEGEYLDFYYGYLLRIGEVVEWYEATQVTQWNHDDGGVNFVVGTSDTKGRLLLVNFTNSSVGKAGVFVHAEVIGKDADQVNRLAIGFETPDDEGFFGFGERFTDCNQRGHRVGSWLEDGSWSLGVFDPSKWKLRVPKGEESTYVPMPLLISTRNYGMQIHSYYRTVFDLAKTTEGVMILEVEHNKLNFSFHLNNNPRAVFMDMVEMNGGGSLTPPPWQFGPWNQLGTEVKGRSNLQQLEDLLFKDVPVSHCVNTVHFFPEGGERGNEEALKTENEKLLSLGVKSTCYFNPMLSSSYKELYDVAAHNNYFTKTKDGLPYNFSYVAAQDFHVSQLDFTNAEAVSWYQQQLQRAVDLKFHGWMYDYGEYTPHDSVSSDGSSGLEMHNHYPLLYQKAAFDFFKSLDPDPSDRHAPDYIFYVRSGYTGSQQYTWAHWTGDPSSDWSYASGLPAQIAASLNIGLSGIPFSGSDIGGFEWYVEPPPDLELWARWTAAGAVSGIMHEQGGGKGNGDKTHIFDSPEGVRIWRKFAKLRTQLFPYIYLHASLSSNSSEARRYLPLMQHHLLNYWYDKVAVSQCYQFMFGDALLAAPVVKKGVTDWDVYLPGHVDDMWLDFSSNVQYDESDGRFRIGFGGYYGAGETVRVKAPLDSVPLFVRAGSVISVLDPRVQTLSNASNSSVISYYDKKDLYHTWIFAQLDFGTRYDQNFSSGCSYAMSLYVDTVLLDVEAPSSESVHIIQVAAAWETRGTPTRITNDPGIVFIAVSSWKDLVADTAHSYAFFYDKGLQVLWIRLTGKSNLIGIETTKL